MKKITFLVILLMSSSTLIISSQAFSATLLRVDGLTCSYGDNPDNFTITQSIFDKKTGQIGSITDFSEMVSLYSGQQIADVVFVKTNSPRSNKLEVSFVGSQEKVYFEFLHNRRAKEVRSYLLELDRKILFTKCDNLNPGPTENSHERVKAVAERIRSTHTYLLLANDGSKDRVFPFNYMQ